MRKYTKSKSEEFWHWEPKCPRYPVSDSTENDDIGNDDLETSFQIPQSGELCPDCIQIESDEKIKLHAKEILGDDNVV